MKALCMVGSMVLIARPSGAKFIIHHAQMLVEKGYAYPCFCTPERLDQMRKEQEAQKGRSRPLRWYFAGDLIRMKLRVVLLPVKNMSSASRCHRKARRLAHDHLRGDIVTENKYLDDYVLLKSDGLPTYHLAAMVDDHEMEITHVIRSAEWLPTFPLHVQYCACLWLGRTGLGASFRFSQAKRQRQDEQARYKPQAMKDGHSIFIDDLKDLGYIPEGVLNWIALMGWGVAEDDVMTLDQMVERFSIDHLDSLARRDQLSKAGSLQRDTHPPPHDRGPGAAHQALFHRGRAWK